MPKRRDIQCNIKLQGHTTLRATQGGGWKGRSGKSSHCEDPAPTVGIGGEIVAGYAAPTIICAHGRINGNGEWEDNDAAL